MPGMTIQQPMNGGVNVPQNAIDMPVQGQLKKKKLNAIEQRSMFFEKTKASSQNIKPAKGVTIGNRIESVESEKLNRVKIPYTCMDNEATYDQIPHFEDIISHIKTQKGSRQMQDFLKKASIN